MEYNAVLECSKVEGSVTEPATLAEAKSWMKVDLTDDDTLITELITVARKMVEGYLCISLVPKTITAILNNSQGGIELPYAPVTSVTSVVDEDDVTLTVTTDYILQGVKFKTIKTPYDYLKVVYVTEASEEEQFKTAVLQQIVFLYENRGDAAGMQLSPMVKETLNPYRRVW